MPAADQGTYTFIPPPPLPEFYKRKKKDNQSTSTASSTIDVEGKAMVAKELPYLVDGAYDGRPRAAALPTGSTAPVMAIPPRPPTAYGNDVPPLAIYHICRLCLRPRSPRYHREHPIPINGLPPPPGICRRCRVTPVEQTKRFADIVKAGESNEIKLGFITPFIPNEDIISIEEMRERTMTKYLRSISSDQVSRPSDDRARKNTTYRHVRVAHSPEDSVTKRKTKVTFTKEALQDDEDEPSSAPAAENSPTKLGKPVNSIALCKIDSTIASVSTHASSSSSSALPVKPVAEVSKVTQPAYQDSDIRKIARGEIERYRDDYWKAARSESNIRRIARKEVERYRQAERKLEAHPDPYAHGRMVPVERRIKQEADIPEPVPWKRVRGHEKVPAPSSTRQQTQAQAVDVAKDEKISSSSTSSSTSTSLSKRKDGRLQDDQRSRDQDRPKSVVETFEKPEYHTTSTLARAQKSKSASSRPVRDDPVLEQRGKDGKRDFERHENLEQDQTPTEPSVSWKQRTWSKFSKPSERDSWYHESVYRSLDDPSSQGYRMSGSDGMSEESARKSFRHVDDSAKCSGPGMELANGEEWTYEAAQEPRPAAKGSQSRSDKRPPYPEHDLLFERIVKPADRVVEQSDSRVPPRSSRNWRDNDDDTEYLYTERIVQPAYRPYDRRAFDDRGPARYMEIEEVLETRRHPPDHPKPRDQELRQGRERSPPASAPRARPSGNKQPGRYERREYVNYEHSKDHPPVSNPHAWQANVSVSSNQDETVPSRRDTKVEAHTERRGSQADVPPPTPRPPPDIDTRQDPRVQFSNEVDISPTPPGSDASSSEIRRFHGVVRQRNRQLDGNGSPERVRGVVEEYEQRGRMRSRESPARHDYHEQHDRSRGREKGGLRDAKSNLDAAERRHYRGERRRLQRALSESPAREGSLAPVRQERPEAQRDHPDSKGTERHTRAHKSDGKGPYRVPEKVTDSMRVEDGSPVKTAWDHREDSYSRW